MSAICHRSHIPLLAILLPKELSRHAGQKNEDVLVVLPDFVDLAVRDAFKLDSEVA